MSNNLVKWRPAWLILGGCMLAATLWFTPAVQADLVLHRELQVVDEDGNQLWNEPPLTPITMRGVVINNPWDMLDYSNSSGFPQWQVYIQTVDPDDFGGTALYMMKKSPHSGQVDYYSDEEWDQEMDRLNHPEGVEPPLQRGDYIEVYARAPGMAIRGKYNINEMHYKDPKYDFDITILERGRPLEASLINLAEIKDVYDQFIFDHTRETGPEHYQASLVQLNGLTLDDPEKWAPNGTVTVRQNGLTMPLKLGLDPGLASVDLDAMNKYGFNVIAIMDQEALDGDFTGSYRLWLTNAADLGIVPEPGTLVLMLVGGVSSLALVRNCVRRPRV